MKLLIIGKIPPPIGGVTIHIERFIEHLKKDKIEYKLLDYTNLLKLYLLVQNYDVAHIHVSNKKLRLILLLFLKILNKKSIVTYHGKYNFKNFFDKCSLKLSSKNILLNDISLINANTITNNNILVGAFIPPLKINVSLTKEKIDSIEVFTQKFSTIYCMNASDFVFDENGNEIYQGTEIINFFKLHPKIGLIFSDPSGKYYNKYSGITNNVLFIITPHQFVDIFKYSNYMIRFTTTDGDSLSVKEALYYNLKVFASNCVERPQGVKLINKVDEILNYDFNQNDSIPKNNYTEILNVYNKILNE